ncbi:MAG: asparagine synthase (glutamine-hydrolyzing), partial [Dehalococcoidia bacterium]
GQTRAVCGICGIFRTGFEPVAPRVIDAMVRTLHHRGPDGSGAHFADGVGLGFTRLAIIDRTPASDQPIIDEGSGAALVFNGEIYNYVELRRELQGLGHQFRSHGDGETILRGYLEWGMGCLERLNGMFAFALFDPRNQTLFLARDRFGEKPLYVAQSGSGLLFGSEMKAILAVRPELRKAEHRAVYRYLARGDLDLDDETFFAGIRSLPAAHYAVIGRDGSYEPVKYWRARAGDVPETRQEAVEGFRELLFDSIRLRLRSDVPLGSSLSGGLDSSSIVAAMHAQKASHPLEQHTFSARFESATHDEGLHMGVMNRAVDAQAHDVWVKPGAFLDAFAGLQWFQEEPIASTSPFAQFSVMRLAREQGTTVLLDGQGADEALAGYDQAHGMFWANLLTRGRVDLIGREAFAYLRRYRAMPRGPALFSAYYLLPPGVREQVAMRILKSDRIVARKLKREHSPAVVETDRPFPDRLRNELVRWQMATQLPEFLRYADRNSMAFSREVRLPFLDHRLVEYCFGLPSELLLDGATTKVVLREAMRGIVPDPILARRDKLAYAPPQDSWLRGPLLDWARNLVSAARSRTEVFDGRAVERVQRDLESGKNLTMAWRVVSTEAWYQRWIDRTPAELETAVHTGLG